MNGSRIRISLLFTNTLNTRFNNLCLFKMNLKFYVYLELPIVTIRDISTNCCFPIRADDAESYNNKTLMVVLIIKIK